MGLPAFSLKELLENGVHFGHQTHRWNPLMEPYIYGVRNGIHIIDLTQTFSLLDAALNVVHETVSKGGSVLFVGTKRQAQKPIAEAAEKSAQYYMNHRWLGGTLTNWKTVSNSISRLKKIDEKLTEGASGLTKKERLNIEREQFKLQSSLGGIRDMAGVPELLFVIDTNKESLAIQEAKKLNIPVVGVIDTNSDPSGIDFPIPGNDDAARSIGLYCDLIAKAALEGMANQLTAAGVDIGASAIVTEEDLSEALSSEKPLDAADSTVKADGGQLESLVTETAENEIPKNSGSSDEIKEYNSASKVSDSKLMPDSNALVNKVVESEKKANEKKTTKLKKANETEKVKGIK